jgi:UDP-N-acetylglucosamine--N-acetylmuramyl-(pentapeptide) pyrophosphoryl-undecaprenol N-acetylglucosamine transferase
MFIKIIIRKLDKDVKSVYIIYMKTIILCGGRTGGPILPLVVIAKNLKDISPLIIGVSGGFEKSVAEKHGYKFVPLLESKISLFSFSSKNPIYIVSQVFQSIWSIVKLKVNFMKSIYTVLKFKPVAIFSAGGFSAVPVIWASVMLSKIGLLKIKIILHQQDPEPGLTNKLTARFADVLTCVFASTKSYKGFENAVIIPNPTVFSEEEIETEITKKIDQIPKEKPTLLIYGGGSGAMFINNWVKDNLNALAKKFYIVHLIGALQDNQNEFLQVKSSNYFPYISLIDEMNYVLQRADVVISRAGLGSISELQFMQKKAYLVPLPNSHQEKNAKEVEEYFEILEQKDVSEWLESILNYNTKFGTKKKFPVEESAGKLEEYYRKVQGVIE